MKLQVTQSSKKKRTLQWMHYAQKKYEKASSEHNCISLPIFITLAYTITLVQLLRIWLQFIGK